jgi:hypothetical protein
MVNREMSTMILPMPAQIHPLLLKTVELVSAVREGVLFITAGIGVILPVSSAVIFPGTLLAKYGRS